MTFKALILKAFGGFREDGNSIQQITDRLTNLPVVSKGSSSVVNMLSTHKICRTQSDLHDTSATILDINASFEERAGTTSTDNYTLLENFWSIIGNGETIESCVDISEHDPQSDLIRGCCGLASVEGVCPTLYWRWSYNNFGTPQRHAYLMISWTDDITKRFIVFHMSPDYYTQTEHDCRVQVTDRDQLRHVITVNPDTQVVSVYANEAINQLYGEITDVQQACCELIEYAGKTGEIVADKALQILNEHMQSNSIQQLKAMFMTGGSFKALSVLQVLASFFKDRSGTYTGGYTYLPSDIPGFSTNIIAGIFIGLLSVLAMVLSAVFRAIGALVMLVVYVITQLWNVIKSNVAITQGSVTSVSDLPAWNIPIGYLELPSVSVPESVIDALQTMGSVALDSPSCPVLVWVVPFLDENQAISKVFIQGFIRPSSESGAPFYTSNGLPTDPTYGNIIIDQEHLSIISDVYDQYNSDDPSYVSFTNRDLEVNACTNFFNALQLMAYDYIKKQDPLIIADAKVGFDFHGYTSPASAYSAFIARYPLSVFRQDPKYRAAIFILLASYYQYFNQGGSDGLQHFPVAASSQTYNPIYDDVSWWVLPQSPTLLTTDATHLMNSCMLMYIESAVGNHSLNAATTSYAQDSEDSPFIGPGQFLATPNCKWPSASRSALISALIITACTIAASAAVYVGVKRFRKQRATAKLALRDAEFQQAQQQYIEDPSTANARKLNRANKKLTRAWKRAGSAGVSMYNGFDTGSDPALSAPSTEELDELLPMSNNDTVISQQEVTCDTTEIRDALLWR